MGRDHAPEARQPWGGLVLCPTPIGNLDDITLRALRMLREADVVLAEDTRHTRRLFLRHGIDAPLLSCHDHNEVQRAQQTVALLEGGQTVVLVSDAGTPGVSDPGYRVVRAVIDAGLPVTALPGASALLPALTLSGLPIDSFLFLGFPGRKAGDRERRLRLALASGHTFAVYESPHRLADLLAVLTRLGAAERQAAVARELTKLYEEVRRGTVAELAAHFAARPPRGELTVVVSRDG